MLKSGRGNGDVLYETCCSRGNLPEYKDMGHHIMLPFLFFFCDGDLFWCEVLVWCSSAHRWMGGDEYGCTRLGCICLMALSAVRRPTSFSAWLMSSQSCLHVLNRLWVSLSDSVPFCASSGWTYNNDVISLLACQLCVLLVSASVRDLDRRSSRCPYCCMAFDNKTYLTLLQYPSTQFLVHDHKMISRRMCSLLLKHPSLVDWWRFVWLQCHYPIW